MKLYCLSDNVDTLTGFRLAGVQGEEIHDKVTLVSRLNKFRNSEDYGIILITDKLSELASDYIQDYRMNQPMPLLVVIPSDQHGEFPDTLSAYIQEAIGIHL